MLDGRMLQITSTYMSNQWPYCKVPGKSLRLSTSNISTRLYNKLLLHIRMKSIISRALILAITLKPIRADDMLILMKYYNIFLHSDYTIESLVTGSQLTNY